MNATTVPQVAKISKVSKKKTTRKDPESTSRPVPELLLRLAYYLHATKVIGISKAPYHFSARVRSANR